MSDEKQQQLVRKLYQTLPGRRLLKVLIRPWVSRLTGAFLDCRISKLLIRRFVRSNQIDLSEFEEISYRSFNDFFSRRIRPECRPVAMEWHDVIAPCDGRLSVHPISQESRFLVKGHFYTMEELVQSRTLAEAYEGGMLLLFRLTVSDYHRYHYPDSGVKSGNTCIDGVLHTVHPLAAASRRLYCENQREYFILHSDNFDDILMMQVGALLVGKICNRHGEAVVQRGQTAGWFEYGGSTVILCFKKGMIRLLPEVQEAAESSEVKVKMGQAIGCYESR